MLYDPRDTSPPAEVEAKLLRKIAATRAPTVRFIRIRNLVLFATASLFVAETFFWWGGMRAETRPGKLILETALGAACIAAVAMWALYGQGRSMLGRSTTFLGVVGLLTPAALLAWKIFWSAQEPGMMEIWPERAGYRCLRLSLSMGVFPLLAMALIRRNTDPNHPRMTGATLGVAAGACAWVFTDLWCPVAYVPHLLLGHVLPITLLAAGGALLGHWLIGVRRAT